MTILLGIFNLVLAAIYHFAAYQFQVSGDRIDGAIGTVLMMVPPVLAIASFFVPTVWRYTFTGILLLPLLVLVGSIVLPWKR